MPKAAQPQKRGNKSKTRSNKPNKALAKKALVNQKAVKLKESDEDEIIRPLKLPSVYMLCKKSVTIIWDNKKVFFGICLIYGILNLILVQGLAGNSNIANLKSELQQNFFGSLGSSVVIYGELLGSAGNGSTNTAGAYQIILFVLASLAIIWSLRQIIAGHTIRVRDSFYQGMSQLIPFILVMALLFIQLVPVIVGAALSGLALGSGIAVSGLEKVIFIAIFILFAIWTFYLLASTTFAVYIVTLPDMTPLKALRSAKKLVKKHRLLLIRKILGLPFVLIVVSAAIMLPIIILITGLAQWIFFILTTLVLLCAHTYLYNLYRELLNE
jgi:hypothetical protein